MKTVIILIASILFFAYLVNNFVELNRWIDAEMMPIYQEGRER